MLEGQEAMSGGKYLALLQNLPFVYILDQYQREDPDADP
jgi:hypothetical protein